MKYLPEVTQLCTELKSEARIACEGAMSFPCASCLPASALRFLPDDVSSPPCSLAASSVAKPVHQCLSKQLSS